MKKQLTEKQKKAKIKKLAIDILKDRQTSIMQKIDKALNSGCIDIDQWNEEDKPMTIPKSIVIAILESEAYSIGPIGCETKLIKKVKKNVKNIKLFI